VIALALLAPSDALGAGELDPTFDGDGKVTTDFGGNDMANGVAIQADGKVVAVGRSGFDFTVARYNDDGTLDTTFSGDGKATTDFSVDDEAFAVVIQADDKVVVAGEASGNFALARYNANGSLDTTFDGDGKIVTDFGAAESANGVAIQSDGKIVAAGSQVTQAEENPEDFALARYSPNGSLDTSFDGDGRVVTDLGGGDNANDVAIQANGKIVAAGRRDVCCSTNYDFAVVRYESDGTLDPTFDGDGFVATDLYGYDEVNGVAIQLDGKIVVAGETGSGPNPVGFGLARYKTDGSLDPSFDGDGKVVTDFGEDDLASDVAIQANGKIVAVGGSGRQFIPPPFSFAVARYNTGGGLDTSFDGDGKVLTEFGSFALASAVAIQSNGKIVAAGAGDSGANRSDFALARYLPGGPPPEISISNATKLEGNAGLTTFSFTVSLSGPSSQTVSVSYRTVDSSTTAGEDYIAVPPTTIVFSPGEMTKTVTVSVKGDVTIEPTEIFFVKLSNATHATIAYGTAVAKIVNDDLSESASCTINGTDGDDVLTGTAGNDVICGGRGNDQLLGLGGADVLKGESGNDVLIGSNGVDLLIGGNGADDLRGESGNDTLRGGDNGGDKLNGGADSDALFGESGRDDLDVQDGVSANDSADGGVGIDSCVFDSGDFVTSCP
jgi:uncharacterized delta-60 repeat protein